MSLTVKHAKISKKHVGTFSIAPLSIHLLPSSTSVSLPCSAFFHVLPNILVPHCHKRLQYHLLTSHFPPMFCLLLCPASHCRTSLSQEITIPPVLANNPYMLYNYEHDNRQLVLHQSMACAELSECVWVVSSCCGHSSV